MLTLVSKDSVKISDHFDVLCVLIVCMVLEIINQMSKNQKSSLIVWNTVAPSYCGSDDCLETGAVSVRYETAGRNIFVNRDKKFAPSIQPVAYPIFCCCWAILHLSPV